MKSITRYILPVRGFKKAYDAEPLLFFLPFPFLFLVTIHIGLIIVFLILFWFICIVFESD